MLFINEELRLHMLHFFRQHNSSIISRIVLAVIALSFGVWGLGSLARPSTKPNDVVAKIGEQYITLSSMIKKMDDSNIPEKSRAEAFPLLLDLRIHETINVLEANRLKFRIPDVFLKHAIQSLPFLHTETGSFDSTKLQQMLDSGTLKKDVIFQYVFSLLTSKQLSPIFATTNMLPGDHVVDLYRSAASLISFSIHNVADATKIAYLAQQDTIKQGKEQPLIEEALKKALSGKWVAGISTPARRSLRAIHVSKQYLKKPQISQKEFLAEINTRFAPIEKRTVIRLQSKDRQHLENSLKKIKSNPDPKFEDENITTTVLHSISSEVSVPWAKAAFSIKKLDNTPISQDGDVFSTAVVLDVTMEAQTPSKEDKDQLFQDMIEQKQQAVIEKIRADLEHRILEAKDLDSVKEAGTRLVDISEIDASGCVYWGANTNTLFGIPLDREALDSIFSAPIQQLDVPITLENGSHLFFVVTQSKEAGTLAKKDIQPHQFIADASTPETLERLKKKGEEIVSKLRTAKTDDLKKIGAKTLFEPITLDKVPLLLSERSMFSLEDRIAIAKLKPGEALSLPDASGMLRIITVSQNKKADPSSSVKGYTMFKEKLLEGLSEQIQRLWAKALYQTHKVEVLYTEYDKAVQELANN